MQISKRNSNKEERRLKMIRAAAEIYSTNGIDSTTIQEIADRAGLGVASVYRYFPGKIDLAIAAAVYMWQEHMSPLLVLISQEDNAWLCINKYMDSFMNLFEKAPCFFRFIENFDNYISRQNPRPAGLKEYEQILGAQDNKMIEILIKGQREKSIKADLDISHFYSVTTRTVMAFAQKLLLRGSILETDKTDYIRDMKTLISIILDSIKIN